MVRSEQQACAGDVSPGEVVDLAIVVVSWNTRDLLYRCLRSVFATLESSTEESPDRRGSLTFEVVVVDNGSTDESAAMVRETFPRAKLLVSADNLGFARANNLALRGNRGRYALLLNPDTEVQPGALQTLLTFMDQHPDVGAAGPLLLNPDGSLQHSCRPAPKLARELWRLFHGDWIHRYALYAMEDWSRTEPRAVDVIQGACLVLRRETLDQVDLLDESFFIYSEEVDLCQRVRSANWKIIWVPSARVIHYGGQSTRQVAEAMFLQLYRGKILYFRKHQGAVAALVYKLILVSASIARLALSPIAEAWRPDDRPTHRLLKRYYRRLIRELPGM